MAIKSLDNTKLVLDYVIVVDCKILSPVEFWDGETKIIVLMAASIGQVRLIDNLMLN